MKFHGLLLYYSASTWFGLIELGTHIQQVDRNE